MGLYSNNNIIGVVSFFKNTHKTIFGPNQYQLRGMAVLEEFQGRGLGTKLLKFGENILKEKNIDIVWCNAREIAVPFYNKNNYKTTGEPFTIQSIGIHYVMCKPLGT
nr:GNAT family N-acetyltransferase [Algibacter onchidii]